MAYIPPTRSAFRATILRALRDPNGVVFPAATVNDFITEAMSDLSAYRPAELNRSMPWLSDTWTVDPTFTEDVSDIWQCIARENEADPRSPSVYIPHADYGDGRAGWDYFREGGFRLARIWIYRLQQWAQRNDTITLNIFGYGWRTMPTGDASMLDLNDPIDQFCITQHCKMLGFQMLNADRALYQQWLAATNNTDVSPTQLIGMLTTAEASYDRARSRNTIIRRRPSNADAIAF